MAKIRLPRKKKKRLSLFRRQLDILSARYKDEPDLDALVLTEASWETPYETIDQERHERRVFGHPAGDCQCTARDVEIAVAWNQPPKSWVGREVAAEYHRRQHRR